MKTSPQGKLASRPFLSLVAAQFMSAFADNALIFALLAQLVATGSVDKSPYLQELFVIPYILLAPFVGPLSDGFPKSRIMMLANCIKTIGCLAALLGFSPFLSYCIVGIGACLYSPAKYGILPQMISPDDIVKANSAMEGGTIAAILLGALAGGLLSARSIDLAITICLVSYGLAAFATLLIPSIRPETPGIPRISSMLSDFVHACKTIIGNRAATSSILGTSAFWGAGASLRLLLVVWIPFALGLHGPEWVSYTMAALSVGIVGGAILAAVVAPLHEIRRAYLCGPFIGIAVLALAFSNSTFAAFSACVAIGLFGGFHVIPLNAMLQEIGHKTVGAGRALAVQNLFENLAILMFAGMYSIAADKTDPSSIAVMFGIVMLINGFVTLFMSTKLAPTLR